MTQEEPGAADRPSESELRRRIAAGSRDAHDYLELAELLKATLRFREAMELYQGAIALDFPKIARARFAWELGSLLHGVQRRGPEGVAKAEEALAFLADEPASRDTLLLRGLSHALIVRTAGMQDSAVTQHHVELAVRELERVLAEYGVSEDTGIANLELAWIYTSMGQAEEAIRCCQAYLRSDVGQRERAMALSALAEAFRQSGRLSDAEEAMKRALSFERRDLAADRPAMFVTMALIQRAGHHQAEALESLERAQEALRKLAPYQNSELSRDVLWYLAEFQCEAGRFQGAIRVLTQLLVEFPDDPLRPRALIWLGECHASMGRYADARSYYQQALTCPHVSAEERTAAQEGLAALPSASSRSG
jgi:tetratricopeptide (TPR) repeat protein